MFDAEMENEPREIESGCCTMDYGSRQTTKTISEPA